MKKQIITLIDYPDNNLQSTKHNVTFIIPLLDKAFKILSTDKLLNLLKKLLTRNNYSIKEKELNNMLHETVHTHVEKNITRKLSVLTNTGLVLHISDYHNCIIDSVENETEIIKTYLQSYENLTEKYNKHIKITHLIFNYIVKDIDSIER